MKALRFFTIVLVVTLLFSTWAPAYAKPTNTSSTSVVDPAKVKLAKLKVNNKTGGTLYVTLSGTRGYSFSTSNQGRTTFDAVIQPGKYNITVRTSACRGELHFKRNVKGGSVNVPAVVCKRKK